MFILQEIVINIVRFRCTQTKRILKWAHRFCIRVCKSRFENNPIFILNGQLLRMVYCAHCYCVFISETVVINCFDFQLFNRKRVKSYRPILMTIGRQLIFYKSIFYLSYQINIRSIWSKNRTRVRIKYTLRIYLLVLLIPGYPGFTGITRFTKCWVPILVCILITRAGICM
jgi:hypothetical protein